MSQAENKIPHGRCGHNAIGQKEDFRRGKSGSQLAAQRSADHHPHRDRAEQPEELGLLPFQDAKTNAGADTM